jgi:hypothetical protein
VNAPLHFTLRTCPLGHVLVGGTCIACTKPKSTAKAEAARKQCAVMRAATARAAQERAAKEAADLAAKEARRLRRMERLAPKPCELHADAFLPCERCRLAHAANAKALAETTPWHERVRAHTYKRGVIGTFRHVIPTHDKAVFE